VALYEEHYDGLARLARLLVRDPSTAEDVVQDAFVRLYGAWGRVREPEKAPAYLRTTVVNLARGRHRRQVIADRFRPERAPDAVSAEEVAVDLESQRQVIAALDRLSARQRECVVLRHYAGLSESEIAAVAGCSIGSVRTHVKRGMAALEVQLAVHAVGAKESA